MKTNRVGNDYVVDVDNSWNNRSKHFLISSMSLLASAKMCFIQPHHLKAAFGQTAEHIFANE